HSEMVSMFEAQGLEINSLKARIKLLEDKDRGVADQSGDDVLIKGRRLDEGEEAAKKDDLDPETPQVAPYIRPRLALMSTTGEKVSPYHRFGYSLLLPDEL
nr:hypothetical protein [Tanacetum cinerariifolium]